MKTESHIAKLRENIKIAHSAFVDASFKKAKACVIVEGEKAIVKLTQCKEAIIDASDAPIVSMTKWAAHKKQYGRFYAVSRSRETGKQIKLHRLILGVNDPKVLVDHRNGNGLDNRRSNLRICNNRLNSGNSRIPNDNKTGFKGVCFVKGKYIAQCFFLEKPILGYFHNPRDAAIAYDLALEKAAGEFALTNKKMGLL